MTIPKRTTRNYLGLKKELKEYLTRGEELILILKFDYVAIISDLKFRN